MADNVPKIRFPGFTEPWEQRKLREIFNSINNAFVGTATPYYCDSGHFYLESNNVKNGKINKDSQIFINESFYQKQKDKWLKHGDIVMVQSGHVGHSAVITEEYNNSAAHALIMFRGPIHSIDSHFINYEFQTQTSKAKVDEIATGNTIKHILASDMKEFLISVPSLPEQQQISRLFLNLDNLITLHQRKLDDLKKFKSGLLQKMFPKAGETVPEVRFPEFTGDWEQRKLGDLIKEFSIKSKIEDEYKVLSSTNSGMKFREGRVTGTSNLGYKIIKNGDLVLSPQNLWLGNININNIGKGLVSPSYKTFKLINIDSSFINPQLRTQKMLEEYKNSSTQGASVVRRNLEIDSFYQIKIFVPTISEQEKIGSFFQRLDNTIVLQHQKLAKCQSVKKSLLQQMFI